MSNLEIIARACKPLGINPDTVHTFNRWRDRGYIVRKGEKARIRTKLWQVRPDRKKKEEDGEAGEIKTGKYVLVNAYLFGIDQVEEKNK